MQLKSLLFLTFSVFLAKNTMACPVWLTGKIYVVNENNERINASIWKVSNSDSFMMEKGEQFNWYDTAIKTRDTMVFEFWEGGFGGWYDEDEPKITRSYYRIHAEGFADLIIKSIDFTRINKNGYPVLYLKMYPRRYHKMGEVTTLLEQYAYNEDVVVSDSLELNYSHYVKALEEKNTAISGNIRTVLAVESYPNPVTEYLILKINSEITEPYSLLLTDMQGKLVKESFLTLNETKYDLQLQAKGTYMVTIHDPKGNPIYSRKFVKM